MLLDCRLVTRSATVSTCYALVLGTATAWQGPAHAQGKLAATYTITFARIPVGKATMAVDLKENEYAMTATGRAGGVMRILANGEAFLATHGIVKDDRPEPRRFTSKIMSEDESQDVTMSVEDGNVTVLAATPPAASAGVEVAEADRQGIVDPLTAMLIPAGAAGDDLPQEACRRTLPIFDGRHRYDLKLSFKRMDKVSAGKGYAGPVVVCSLGYQPIAGHRASTPLVKYLSEGREMEIVLAPVAGTRVLAPFRLSVVSMLANLVIQADRFEAVAQPPAAPTSADPKGQ
jgi:uncharacterized protein DUF3108